MITPDQVEAALAEQREGIAAAIMAQRTYRAQWGTVRGITVFTATYDDAQIALNYRKAKEKL